MQLLQKVAVDKNAVIAKARIEPMPLLHEVACSQKAMQMQRHELRPCHCGKCTQLPYRPRPQPAVTCVSLIFSCCDFAKTTVSLGWSFDSKVPVMWKCLRHSTNARVMQMPNIVVI